MMKWARDWLTRKYAAERGHTKLLRWAEVNGCPDGEPQFIQPGWFAAWDSESDDSDHLDEPGEPGDSGESGESVESGEPVDSE